MKESISLLKKIGILNEDDSLNENYGKNEEGFISRACDDVYYPEDKIMNKIYIVEGSTGEYMIAEWFVKAFASEQAAKDMVARLAAWCDERRVGENHNSNYDLDRDIRYSLREAGEHPPEDPDWQCDYTGTRYSYSEVPFEM